jgi:hypothetical protein
MSVIATTGKRHHGFSRSSNWQGQGEFMMKRISLSVLALLAVAPAAAQTAPPGYEDFAPEMREAMAAAALPPPVLDARLAPAQADYTGAELPAGWRPATAASWQGRGQAAPAQGAIVPAAMTIDDDNWSSGPEGGIVPAAMTIDGDGWSSGPEGAIVPAALTMQDGGWNGGPQGGVVLAGWNGGRGGWNRGDWNRGGWGGNRGWDRGSWGRGWNGYRGWDRGWNRGWGGYRGWDRGWNRGWGGYRGGWRGYPVYNGWGGGWGGYRPRGYYAPPVVIFGGSGWGGDWGGGGYYGRPYRGHYGRCRSNGSGALIGGVTGATLGYGLGNRWDRTPGVIIGGVLGALAGNAIERSGC